ncbi:MAG: Ig-like domain-containing protein, partial [Rivularia sp. (in: cyanobacteria)]
MATEISRTPNEQLNGPQPQQAVNNTPPSGSQPGTEAEDSQPGTEAEDSQPGTEAEDSQPGTESEDSQAGAETGTEETSQLDSQPGTESELETQENNNALTAQNDTYTIASGQSLDVDADSGVLTNDTAPEGANLSATVVDPPDSGSYTFTSDGSFTYTSLDGFSGTDTFIYTVSDGESTSEPATVEINVEAPPPGSNSAPIAQNDIYATAANQPLNVAVDAGVLANDTDAEGNTLNATVVDNPTNGSYTFTSDGSFTYTPLEGFNGTDSFTYTVSDGTS